MKPTNQMTLAELDAEYDLLIAPFSQWVDFEGWDDGGVVLDGKFTLEELRTLVRISELVAETRRRGFP